MNLNNKLEEIIKNEILLKKSISILLKDITQDEPIYDYNYRQKIISASLIKVPIMLAIFEEINKERLSLNYELIIDSKKILLDTQVFELNQNVYFLGICIYNTPKKGGDKPTVGWLSKIIYDNLK